MKFYFSECSNLHCSLLSLGKSTVFKHTTMEIEHLKADYSNCYGNSSPTYSASSSIKPEMRVISCLTFPFYFLPFSNIVCRRTPGVISIGAVSLGNRQISAKMYMMLLLYSFFKMFLEKL